MSHPNAAHDLADEWEEFEDDAESGVCMDCKEHSTPVYMRHKITKDLDEATSSCCGAGIWLP